MKETTEKVLETPVPLVGEKESMTDRVRSWVYMSIVISLAGLLIYSIMKKSKSDGYIPPAPFMRSEIIGTVEGCTLYRVFYSKDNVTEEFKIVKCPPHQPPFQSYTPPAPPPPPPPLVERPAQVIEKSVRRIRNVEEEKAWREEQKRVFGNDKPGVPDR